MARGHGGDDGDFTAEAEGGGDFGQCGAMACAFEAEDVEACGLGWQRGAAADGTHKDVGHGDGAEQAALATLHPREADGGFRDAGSVLAGGDVEGGEAVGVVSLSTQLAGEQRAEIGDAGVIQHVVGGGVQGLFDQRIGERDGGGHLAAPAGDGAEGRGFLVTGKIAFDIPAFDRDGAMFRDGFAKGIGGDCDHVLASGVTGGVAAEQEGDVVVDDGFQRGEFAVVRGGLGGLFQQAGVADNPVDEHARLKQGVEGEGGGAQDAFVEDGGGDAARLGRDIGTAGIGGDEGGLGRGHGDVVIAVGVKAVDAQGACDADGDFDGADHVFDIRGVVVRMRNGIGISDGGFVGLRRGALDQAGPVAVDRRPRGGAHGAQSGEIVVLGEHARLAPLLEKAGADAFQHLGDVEWNDHTCDPCPVVNLDITPLSPEWDGKMRH